MSSEKPQSVAEIEGEYGPITISERLVQKIWFRGDFLKTGLKTQEGESLDIIDLGQWNLLAGPDFKNMAIRVNGEVIRGDGELHFFESDWEAHGHASNPDFNNVILHILVFPSKKNPRTLEKRVPHSLFFLELLPQGLECYAEEEALGALSGDQESELEIQLLMVDKIERQQILQSAAQKRWEGKVVYGRRRIETLGWEAACHQTALEILGFRHNRMAMLLVAGEYSLEALRSGDFTVQNLFESAKGRWRMSGTRPANHPKARLGQYLEWVKHQPFWPNALKDLGESLFIGDAADILNQSRRELRLKTVKKEIAADLLGNSVGGTRFQNLVCDGLLPLLSAETEKDLFGLWYHWYPGDAPDALKNLHRRLNPKSQSPLPVSNGALQGLLQMLLEYQAPVSGK